MDIEGIDVNMILPSGGVPAFCSLPDVALEQAVYQAYHRFLRDYCAPYPDRLTSLVLASGRDPAAPVAGDRALRAGAVAGGHLPDLPAGDDPRSEAAKASDSRFHVCCGRALTT